MPNLQTFDKQNLTMSSREIAELTGKEHGNVMRDVRAMIKALEQDSNLNPVCKTTSYTASNGQQYDQYELDKNTCLTLLLGYDPVARMRVVERWQELEAQFAAPALPDFSNPAEAARAWAVQYEQRLALEVKVAEDAPKVEFYHDVTGSDSVIDMATVAKVLNRGIGRNRLFAFLRDEGVLDGRNAPYQRFIDMGWFRQVETKWQKPNGDWQIGIKTVVFQKGVEGIARLLDRKEAA